MPCPPACYCKKLPIKLASVKVASVKLNSFYTEHSLPLVFTVKNETVVSVAVDETKATTQN